MNTQGTTRLSKTFCSAQDRNISVLVKQSDPNRTESTVAQGSDLVSCLEYGVSCTGWLCPLFSVPTLPPEELLAEAIETERKRKDRSIAQGRAILERALTEGRTLREEEARRRAARRSRELRDLTSDAPPTP